MTDLGLTEENGWGCDGRHLPRGCARGCTGFQQSAGWGRWRCRRIAAARSCFVVCCFCVFVVFSFFLRRAPVTWAWRPTSRWATGIKLCCDVPSRRAGHVITTCATSASSATARPPRSPLRCCRRARRAPTAATPRGRLPSTCLSPRYPQSCSARVRVRTATCRRCRTVIRHSPALWRAVDD